MSERSHGCSRSAPPAPRTVLWARKSRGVRGRARAFPGVVVASPHNTDPEPQREVREQRGRYCVRDHEIEDEDREQPAPPALELWRTSYRECPSARERQPEEPDPRADQPERCAVLQNLIVDAERSVRGSAEGEIRVEREVGTLLEVVEALLLKRAPAEPEQRTSTDHVLGRGGQVLSIPDRLSIARALVHVVGKAGDEEY